MIWILLVAFQLKHWLADYPLQRPWMLGKFKPGWSFVLPLAAHCAVHAVITYGIATVYALHHPSAAWVPLALAGFDFVMHFTMDRIKASPKLMGRWKPLTAIEYGVAVKNKDKVRLRGNVLFWWALGIDQGFHHLTHYAIIAVLLWA